MDNLKWEILVDGGLETGKKFLEVNKGDMTFCIRYPLKKMISKLGSLEGEIPVDKGLKTGKNCWKYTKVIQVCVYKTYIMTTWILKYNTDCTILCSIYTTLHGGCGKLHLTPGIQTHGLARSYGWIQCRRYGWYWTYRYGWG